MKFNLDKQDIWVTSDTHYGHKNICRGISEWNDGSQSTRDFNTIEDMNQAIIDGINDRVKENDILIHLGDWSFGGIDNIWNFRKQINCKNIYLVYGNHDHHIKNNALIKIDVPLEILNATNKVYSVFTKPLFTYTDHVLDFTITSNDIKGKLKFFCSHYAHRIWDKSHHGVMHLYGHSHGSLEDVPWGKSMDVGIDNAIKLLGEYKPFNILEVYNILKVRDTHIIDHHNELTN